jgi:glycolate oxidase FAD binding subunit
MLEPRDARDLRQIVADAVAEGSKLELRGGGTKAEFGAPREANIISLHQIAGVLDYDPAELVLTVRPGTPLTAIEAMVAGEGQMLAFEPWGEPGATIGGIVAAGVAGSRRVTAGSARDHLLGFTAISGRGESLVAGAKVVKNVTGYDLPKLMAGSWGRLGAMTELTLKVLPRPRVTVTMLANGLSPRAAHAAMACALGSNAEVSAAAHLPSGETLLRIAGFAPSVEARCLLLPRLMESHCTPLWRRAMTGAELVGAIRWKVHLPPARAPELLESLAPLGIDWAMDWGGGLVWIALDHTDMAVRTAAAAVGGEATLVHAPADMRATVPTLHERAPGVMALEQRVRRAFDPSGVFVTGRFMEDVRADQLSA